MKYLFTLVFLFSILFNPSHSFALSCIEPLPIEDSFHDFEAVIAAKVIAITQFGNVKHLEVEVEKSFKEINSKNLKIKEDITWGTSETGKTYLFFLNEYDGTWENPLCSPTTLYDSAKDEFVLQGKEIPLIHIPEMKSDNDSLISIVDNNPTKAVAVTLLTLLVVSFLITHNTLKSRKRKKE